MDVWRQLPLRGRVFGIIGVGTSGGIGVDPYLTGEDFETIVQMVSSFGGRARRGYYGQGCQVTCSRVEVAIRAIGQTCEMEINCNPLYRAPYRYLKPIELMFAGFRKKAPLPVPELAVPVVVPYQCALLGLRKGATPKKTAICDLALISFFYLLSVGKYTQKRRRNKTRTIQFRICDMAFKRGNTVIPRDISAAELVGATAVTLHLSNQKKGIRGSIIHRSTAGGKYFPVAGLVR